MYAIGTQYGVILKFDSLSDLRDVIANLDGMYDWAERSMAEGHSVKLVYVTLDDSLGDDARQELDKFTDSLPDVGVGDDTGA